MLNGFVRTCILAYSEHHHLYIRPEDVWFAILNQLSFYINAHAEELRKFFVSHDGQKQLAVVEVGTLHSVDHGALAVRMTYEIEKKVNDPELRTWVMPDFSTTTNSDQVIAAVLFMGAMQQYFSYEFRLICGIPSVTVLGERADWEKIRSKLDKTDQLGEEPAQFAALLKIVLDFFVKTFDQPEDPDVIDFWGRIAHENNNMSGPNWLSGWVTAFCFWDYKGKRIGGLPRSSSLRHSEPDVKYETDENVTATSFRLDLDQFHTVKMTDIPNGYSSVPITVNDNGIIYQTRMVAGSVGMQAWSSGQLTATSTDRRSHRMGPGREYNPNPVQPQVHDRTGIDSIQPVSGWWMYEVSDAADAKWKEIQDMERGVKRVKDLEEVERKKKYFNIDQKKMGRKSKLREVLDAEKAKVKLESTQIEVAAN
jgi:hypothetical protein